MNYEIDLDIIKQIFYCHSVTSIQWRISSSGHGFHFRWTCNKTRCQHCSLIEKKLDDPKRYQHDLKRAKHQRRILWDRKGGRKAKQWHTISKTSVSAPRY